MVADQCERGRLRPLAMTHWYDFTSLWIGPRQLQARWPPDTETITYKDMHNHVVKRTYSPHRGK